MTEEKKVSSCQIIIKSVTTEITTTSISGDDPVVLLPIGLQHKLIHRAAFRRAFEQGMLCVENGAIVSQLGSLKALTYLLGRLYSNDRSRKVANRRVWVKGDRAFPATELNALFSTRNLRGVRNFHLNNEIPQWFETIDNLFVTR